MPLLHVAFQEGFEADTVAVYIDGNEAFRKDNVKTRLQIGYADSFENFLPEGSRTVNIVVPEKNLSQTVQLQLTAATYLGVSIEQCNINCKISDQPFGYV
ncbi:MAG: hypothetical protein HYU31_04375 [Deltaproteobacteria bacterium]|nr:hypothetical protein [Deltaproteobacteria bacterium]MBI2365090.1 hypothetical protein [Deltaproteobacteria bacterium]MBI2534911.1 hypothetical protein [Deltaproteobacteria bacterium]MBI3066652.1 hypothetical protein [Deltaproteobacteria bacterium]